MKKNRLRSRKVLVALLSLMLIVTFSFSGQTAFAMQGNGVVASEDDSLDIIISLSEDTEDAMVSIPMDVSLDRLETAIAAGDVKLSLDRDGSKFYLDEEMFPNQKPGGPLSTWKSSDGQHEIFQNIEMEAREEGSNVYLDVMMDIGCYFYSRGNKDYSAPHANGGAYLDICGYFNFNALINNSVKGTATAKVTPYKSFHTMDEVYADIDAMAEYDTHKYVEKFSMGQSTAGRDMPYLIVAKDQKTVDDWLAYCELVEDDPDAVLKKIRAGNTRNIKVPVLYSNIHSNEIAAVDGIIDFAWNLIREDTIDYKYLEGFTDEGEAQILEEMGTPGEAGSVAIPDLVAEDSTYLGWLKAGNRVSGKVDLEKYYDVSTREYNVDDILEDVFFIIVPEENVDGRAQDTRVGSNGYDLNRDNSFQTTPETANMQKLIGAYNPVSLVEFHGRVQAFQCEPCDPPHEPNFEYDLLARQLMKGGEAVGIAAVANNESYNSYVIPQRDYLEYTGEGDETYWADPWDDMSTSYTPQYAMLHGATAFTVELPAYSEDTTQLVSYGIIGNSAYVASAKNEYLEMQAEIYKRGVENYNSDSYEEVGQWLADQYDVEGAEMEIFRPEYDAADENGNFYPEAYIIPIDRANQKNLQAAADMIVYLTRNDVKVYEATKEFKVGDVTYPEGSFIVPMYQAKRSVANGVLNNGTLINSWTVLYSEGITAFNKTRGFDMAVTAKPREYTGIKAAMGAVMSFDDATAYRENLASSMEGEQADVIIENVSEDSTAAVNALLKDGKDVGLITEGEHKGDFLVKYSDYEAVAKKYVLTATGVYAADEGIVAKKIKAPKVFIVGKPAPNTSGYVYTSQVGSAIYNYDRYAMEIMNFDTVADVADASTIVGGGSISGAAVDAVKAGTPYITYTSASGNNLRAIGVAGASRTGLSGAMDCLKYVEYPEETMVNSNYVNEGDDIMYGYNAGYFSAIPAGAKAIVRVVDKTPLEGFVPTQTAARKNAFYNYLDGGTIGFEYAEEGYDIAAFAETLTHKLHQRDEYQFISNFIFSRNLSEEDFVGETANKAVNDVVDMINKLPEAGKETAEDKAAIDAAKAAYDKLTPEEKELVDKLTGEDAAKKLEDAKAAADKKAAEKKAAEDKAAADKAAADKAAAEKAAAEKKAAEEKAAAEKKAAADKAAADAVAKQIAALPAAGSQKASDKAKVDAAAAAYDKLTAEQKALVPKASVDKLTAAKKKAAEIAKTPKKPGKVKIKKAKGGKKKATVTWKKISKNTKGYQIRFKPVKKGKGKAKTVTVKKNNKKTMKKVVKKLKKGTYKVQVRAYNQANGKKVYGKWSKAKKVKVS